MKQNESSAYLAMAVIQKRVTNFQPKIGVILGSGLGGFADWDEDFSSAQHEEYLSYVYLLTAISVLTATASTLACLFPIVAVPIMVASNMLGSTLTLFAFYYWQKSAYVNYQSDCVIHSYQRLSNGLEFPLKECCEQQMQSAVVARQGYINPLRMTITPRKLEPALPDTANGGIVTRLGR